MKTPKRISLIPAAGIEVASSRIRVYQLRQALAERGVTAQIGFTLRADAIFVQKRLTRTILFKARLARRMGQRVIYDVDDLGAALWYWAPKRLFRQMLLVAHDVCTCTEEQSTYLQTHYGVSRCQVVPNSIDYFPQAPVRPTLTARPKLRVVWFGNSSNFRLLEKYIPTLTGNCGVDLVAIVGAKELARLQAAHPRIEFIPWQFSTFVPALQKCDLACLMHDGDEADLNKGNNRMVTAIHYGVPAVVSRTPEYARTARELAVEHTLFGDARELEKVICALRSPAARKSYLEVAQPRCWDLYSPRRAADHFLKLFTGHEQPQDAILG